MRTIKGCGEEIGQRKEEGGEDDRGRGERQEGKYIRKNIIMKMIQLGKGEKIRLRGKQKRRAMSSRTSGRWRYRTSGSSQG
jgi:hypothetical protein